MAKSAPALVSAVAAVLAAAGCGDRATPAMFAGSWSGHTRALTITADGRGRESIYSGCCHFVLAMRFRLSHAQGTPGRATATATVTRVRVGDRTAFTAASPPPRVGESGTIGLRDGVITESLTGTTYCSTRAKRWVCGA
ncbi:MAG TPA: hypothetical protein VFJ91_06685 [Gaiellaceae bacterium]|nr:hypothetical protein [Gaiellaceae bacterium]